MASAEERAREIVHDYYMDGRRTQHDLEDAIAAALRQAQEEMRERCALVADAWWDDADKCHGACDADLLAAAIRKLSVTP